MARRTWHCLTCRQDLGHITTDRDGGDHLRVFADAVTLMEPVVPGEEYRITCRCGGVRSFFGRAVHLHPRDRAA
jgi:hypothetical protein